MKWTPPAFPENFIWGTAASSTQTEGAAPASNWAVWERSGKAPPSGEGSGFAKRFAEDFSLLASLGLDHHRLSLEWARIEPQPGIRDRGAIDHYLEVLEQAQQCGLKIWVCLHHFTLPAWFEDLGGFQNPEARKRHWIPHVEFVAETFGDRVYGWKPINEPMAYTAGGFLFGAMPPGKQSFFDFADATVAIFEALRDATNVLSGAGPIATIHNLSPVIPVEDDPAAEAAAKLIDATLWGIPIRAYLDGVVAVPGRDEVRIEGLEGSADLFGFSYYNCMGVGKPGGALSMLGTVTTYPPGSPPGPLGYHPWPDGLGMVLDRLHQELKGVPLLIAENGIGTKDDEARRDFLARSLEIVSEKISAGYPIEGYFHWTSVDNYEWLAGFDVPFGIITTSREPKPSASILKAAANAEPIE